VSDRSFPLASRKLVATGHGIEIPQAARRTGDSDAVLRLLALGRTSPAKGLQSIVAAVELLSDLPLVAELRGPSLTEEERGHRTALGEQVAAAGLVGRVELAGPVARREVPSVLARTDALVNNMRAGALDKVVFEAAAAGLPVVVASDGFAGLVDGLAVPLRFRQDDPAEIADRIRGLHDLGPAGREAVGAALRERVRRDHSVEHWANAVVAATQ
jgi:glycosyltransferase involved in cell wall biosynthesis